MCALHARLRAERGAHGSGEAHVSQLGRAVSGQQHVGALQVVVDNASSMEVVQAAGNVKRNLATPAHYTHAGTCLRSLALQPAGVFDSIEDACSE